MGGAPLNQHADLFSLARGSSPKAGCGWGRGRRNEPAFAVHTAQRAAEIFGMDWAEFAAQTEANFERLFTKAVL